MSNSNKKDSEQPKPSVEDLKKLMHVLQQQKQLRGKANPASPKMNKFAQLLYLFIQKSVFSVDRLINFIIKPTDPGRNSVLQKARGPVLFGGSVIISFVLFGGVWSAIAPLDSAAVAVGVVISSTNNKIIQHHGGGIIKKVYVKQGDYVKNGQALIELDDTQSKAEHDSYLHQYRTLLATEARLTAELEKKSKISFQEILIEQQYLPEVKKLMSSQEELFNYRRELLKDSIIQLQKKIEAVNARKVALKKNLDFYKSRINNFKTLLNKGFANKSMIEELETKEATSLSELASMDIEISNTHQEINKYNNDYINRTLEELRKVQVDLVTVRERYYSILDVLNKAVIRSPVDGIINVLNFHTQGGVIGGGSPIAEISPFKDMLVVEAKIPQKYIDSVHVGLKAKMRFSAFKSRTTPVFTGMVVSVSPDVVHDRQAAAQFGNPMLAGDGSYYVARIEINMDEFNKIAKDRNLSLHPGMQAEIQIVTGTRTLLKYLLDPVTDNMFKAFKEK